MKKNIIFIVACLLLSTGANASVKIATWNLCHLGQTKSDSEIATMAKIVRDIDILAVQEINTTFETRGPQAAAKLLDELNRTGAKWDMRLSDPTTKEGDCGAKERYAFFWKTSRVKLLGDPWLDKRLKTICCREPFMAKFEAEGKQFLVLNFHALRHNQAPESEVKYFKKIPLWYELPIVFCGDWNLVHHHTVFFPLKKMGYKQVLTKEKTTLKRSIDNGDYLANPIDNILFPTFFMKKIASGTIDLYQQLGSLEEARAISDHLPVWSELDFKE